jgi:hypothetical protein
MNPSDDSTPGRPLPLAAIFVAIVIVEMMVIGALYWFGRAFA